MSETLQAPFPWFGGKSRAAALIWERLGDVPNYVEPFAGSLAVLLGRPHAPGIETVNDLDGFIANFWRAMAHDPEQLAIYAAWPVNENDLTARHAWLVGQRESLTRRLEGDPDYFDAKIAGYWVWGISCWIGSGWCSGQGPWRSIGGEMVDTRKLPHLSGAQGVNRKLPHLSGDKGGIPRQIPNIGNGGKGYLGPTAPPVMDWFLALGERTRKIRVCCGDWNRVLGPTPTHLLGLTGIVLDPPYDGFEEWYSAGQRSVFGDVWDWAMANGDNPLLRIALCGYDAGQKTPEGWVKVNWVGPKGYSNTANRHREVIWFSPACLNPAESLPLFAGLEAAT